MNRWAKPGVILAATALAAVAATGAYAMSGGGRSSARQPVVAASTPAATAATNTGPSPEVNTACSRLEGCGESTPVAPELTCEEAQACTGGGSTASCAPAGGACDDIAPSCTAETIPSTPGTATTIVPCRAPGVLPSAPICAQQLPIDVCYPNARPAGPYVCEAPEPGGAAPRCYPPDCAPQEPCPALRPTVACSPPPVPPCGRAAEPCGCVVPMRGAEVSPCAPPSGCGSSNEGTKICIAPDPPTCVDNENCAPTDCSISSDGVIACPAPAPPPTCLESGCSSPGAPPTGGPGGGNPPAIRKPAGE